MSSVQALYLELPGYSDLMQKCCSVQAAPAVSLQLRSEKLSLSAASEVSLPVPELLLYYSVDPVLLCPDPVSQSLPLNRPAVRFLQLYLSHSHS